MAHEMTMARPILEGNCKGGPWDGKRFAHYAKTKEFFEPRIAFHSLLNLENAEVIPTKVGEYYWGANGLWIWLPEGTQSRRRSVNS